MSKSNSLIAELRRRNVIRMAGLYLVGAWLITQVAGTVLPMFGAPDWLPRSVVILLAIGFLPTLIFSWIYEVTPEGLKRESDVERHESITPQTGRRIDRMIIVVLVLALTYFGFDKFVLGPRRDAALLASAHPVGSAPGARPPLESKSIAVLPFVNMSGDAQNEYFSDGITDEILNALAQIPDLKVAARTSAFAFKGKAQDLRQVGETLGVASVLEGSVQRSGDDVRITAQLIDAQSGYHRWSQKYDRKLTSIFAVEDEISKAIAEQLQVTLGGPRETPLVKQGTADAHAHELYLRGLTELTRRGSALTRAAQLFEQAVAADPNYAAGWAGVSQVYELLPWYDLAEWQPSLIKAESAARRALALDPGLAEAHAALANVLRDQLDYAPAEKEYERALAAGPGSSEAHDQFGQLLGAIGRFDEAIEQERIAADLDPIAPMPLWMLGATLLDARRPAEAIDAFGKVVAQNPDFLYGHYGLALTYLFSGKYAEASVHARAGAAALGEDPNQVAALIQAVAEPKFRPAALKFLPGIHRLLGGEMGEFAPAFWEVQLGAPESALERMQRWADTAPSGRRFNALRYLWLPAFDPVRADPRFKAVLGKLRVPDPTRSAGT